MKLLVLIATLLIASSFVFAQDDSVVAGRPLESDTTYRVFTNDQVLTITNKIKKMQAKLDLYDSLTVQYQLQMATYEQVLENDKRIISNLMQQQDAYERNDSLYKQIISDMEPKWYENNFLWVGVGLVVGFLVGTR